MSDWQQLAAECRAWEAAGRTLRLWWRDDDAHRPTPPLERLLALRRRVDLPLGLAVIPAELSPSLGPVLAGERRVQVLQHGYAHRNHAPAGEKQTELGDHRPLSQVMTELLRGWERLERRLPAVKRVAVMVPPWNRVGAAVLGALAEHGYVGVSTFDAAPADARPPQVNTHLDPVAWRAGRGFVGTAAAIGQLLEHMQRLRRSGRDEVLGVLTHHLAMDQQTWDFCEGLFVFLAGRPGVRWVSPGEAFGAATSGR